MSINPFSTCSIKCQYLIFICLVLSWYLGTVAIVFAPMLSSNTLHLTLLTSSDRTIFYSLSSSIRLITGIVVLKPLLRAINSASVVLSAVSVCILYDHVSGQPVYVMINPVLDFAVDPSIPAVVCFQFPQKSATHQSSSGLLLGRMVIPMCLVFISYLLILSSACL